VTKNTVRISGKKVTKNTIPISGNKVTKWLSYFFKDKLYSSGFSLLPILIHSSFKVRSEACT